MTSATLRRGVVEELVEVACGLTQTRSRWLNGYRFGLRDLRRLDERIEAHLDGMLVAPEVTEEVLGALLEEQEPGAICVATLIRLLTGAPGLPDWLVQQLESSPPAAREIDAAFSWVPLRYLHGLANGLLTSADLRLRRIAIAAATAHRVKLERAVEWLNHDDIALASEAARHIGALRVAPIGQAPPAGSRAHVYWTAWAGLLLGQSVSRNLQALARLAAEAGDHTSDARAICLLAMPIAEAHELLRVTTDSTKLRLRIEGCALIGDPRYVEWLIGQMGDPAAARVAGEAFCTITGVDLVHQELDGEPLADDADEDDRPDTPLPETEDADLLWPDARKVTRWWHAHRADFEDGRRYLSGSVLSTNHCLGVLRTRYQRQRALAAFHLGLDVREVPLFDIGLPAWRQQQELEAFSLAGRKE